MAAAKKRIDIKLPELIKIDDRRLEVIKRLEDKRAHQNKVSAMISTTSDEEQRRQLISEMQDLKKTIHVDEQELKDVMKNWHKLMLQVPNIPDMTVPDGESDADNQELRVVGDKHIFDFEAQDHISLMTKHGMVDFERGAKVHGFRGYYLLGDGAKLSWAIWNYANNFFLNKGFIPVIPPTIVRKENLYGTGHLPNEADDVYNTQDKDYLTGTSEVSVMGFHSGEILDKKQLPLKYLGFSPCYRREAGSHGKDTKGLIRVHEFYKLEQVILCKASHEESVKWHEWLNRNTEEFIETLGIPYRTVINCGADLGQGQVKKYDIELWVPGENKYREISSASYFHDFQTRRFNIRYREEDGKLYYAHSLNCTAIPTPRIMVSLVENFQQTDGSIVIPEVLRSYFGGDKIG